MEIHKLTELATIKSFIEASSYIQTSYLYKLPQNYDDIDTFINQGNTFSRCICMQIITMI